jgi:hypothetical protein
MQTKFFGDSVLTLELEQNGPNLFGKMTFDGYATEDVNGSVNYATVNLSGVFKNIETNERLEIAFQGTLQNGT